MDSIILLQHWPSTFSWATHGLIFNKIWKWFNILTWKGWSLVNQQQQFVISLCNLLFLIICTVNRARHLRLLLAIHNFIYTHNWHHIACIDYLKNCLQRIGQSFLSTSANNKLCYLSWLQMHFWLLCTTQVNAFCTKAWHHQLPC